MQLEGGERGCHLVGHAAQDLGVTLTERTLAGARGDPEPTDHLTAMAQVERRSIDPDGPSTTKLSEVTAVLTGAPLSFQSGISASRPMGSSTAPDRT